MSERQSLLELMEAVIEMRSLQKDYDKTFRGKASKITAEMKVDRLILFIKKDLKKKEKEKQKELEQDLF